MDTKEKILQTLQSLKPELQGRYKVKEIGLFGSFLHKEQNSTSDIDLLVEFTEDADLLDLVALGSFLEEQFQRKVDIVTPQALREEYREQVLQEVAMV